MAELTTALLWAGASSAWVTGLTGSLHCGLMCGPLACAPLPTSGGRSAAAIAWHVGRVAAYVVVGALLGSAGAGLAKALTWSVQPYLPWVMAAGLVVTALDVGRHLKPLPGVRAVASWLSRLGAKLPAAGRSFALGATTPFLPCGLLYGMFLAALATGTPLGGGVVLGAFSFGAVPVFVGLQLGAQQSLRWPTAAAALRRAVPLAAAALLIVRALTTQDPADCH